MMDRRRFLLTSLAGAVAAPVAAKAQKHVRVAEQMEALARELVANGVDVIVAAGPEARIAAMSATTTIPIVVIGGSDAVAEGWAASLARPGGNVTGLTVTLPELLLLHMRASWPPMEPT